MIDPARVLEAVKKIEPRAEAAAVVREGRRGATRFAASEITTAVDADLGEIVLTVALGNRHATASTNRADKIAELVERAVQMAKLAPEDPEWLPLLGPQSFAKNEAAFDPSPLSNELRARAARDAIDRCAGAGVVGAGFYDGLWARESRATSAGFHGEHARTQHRYTMTARTPDKTGSGWASGEETRAASLDVSRVSDRAIERALRSQRPRALAPGKYTVVLEPDAVGDLLSFFIEALGAREADEGRSYFSRKRIGDALFAPSVTLRSDPSSASTPGRPYDDDGLPLAAATWIDRGKLGALACTRYWAKRSGKEPSGAHGTYELAGGAAPSVEALVKKVDKGLLVTRFWYTRWLDPSALLITGLTRDGVFWIEKGEIAYPVNNFRFNESAANMLAKCDELTAQTTRVPSELEVLRVPALLAHEFEMSSVSAAV